MENARGRRLGQVLLDRGWISNDQLLRAIQNQAAVGGRLGTCLLEMDFLPEDVLLRALAEQRGVTAASVEDLRNVPEEVYQLLPPKVAKRCGAVPFRLDGTLLHVAMVEVDNLAFQDELAFVTGKRLRIHVANEARVFEAIKRYYGEETPARFGHLLDRLNRARYQSPPQLRPTPAPPPRLATAPVPVAAPAPPAAAAEVASRPRSIPLGQDERDRLERPSAAPLAAGPAAVPSFADVEARLMNPADREEIGRALLDYLGPRFTRVVLLIVRRDEVAGWMGRGAGLDPQRLRAFHAPFDQPSLFLNLLRGGSFYLGPLRPMAAHQALAAAWGGELPGECLLLPVHLRERLVTLIYCDRGGAELKGLDVAGFQHLAAKAAIAFELCIMRGKLRKA